jgi:proline racemase
VEVGGRPTVEVEIGGESWPTGDHVFRFDEADPLLVNDWET